MRLQGEGFLGDEATGRREFSWVELEPERRFSG